MGGIKTNRIASVNGTAFSYDASGNVTGDGARAYTYDAENRVVSVSGLSSESYGYDAGNRRVKKVVGGVVTHYIWEGDQVIADYERGSANTPATGTRYYHQDGLSTRGITDGAGNVVGTTDHLPFGEEVGGSGEGEKHKFTTYERDGTGLYYAVNRHYDPRQGRFNQVDPLGMGAASLADPQSLNLYSYVRNDPVNSTDPSGLRMDLGCEAKYSGCGGGGDNGGSGYSGTPFDSDSYLLGGYGEVPKGIVEGLRKYDERVANAQAGNGFRTIGEIERATTFNIYYWIYDDGSYATYFNLPVSDAETEQRRQSHIRSAADDLLYSNKYAIDLSAKPIPLGLGETNPILRNYNNFADSEVGSVLMVVLPLPVPSLEVKTVNLLAKTRLVNRALAIAERFLGKGYTEIAPGVFRSSDGLRQVRMTATDILGTHGNIGPHFNFEIFIPQNLRVPARNYHMPIR
jgi:RHS repeat-associated protein